MKRLLIILLASSLLLCISPLVTGKQRSSSTVKREQRENQQQINKTKQQIADNEQKTRRKLNHLNSLQGEILKQNRDITRIEATIDSFRTAITNVEDTIEILEKNIAAIKAGYAESLRQKRAGRKTTDSFTFIFSSPTFMQAFKRMGYLQQAEKWRQNKAEELNRQKELLALKRTGLSELHESLSARLAELGVARTVLQKKEQSTAQAVSALKSEGKSLQNVLVQRQNKARTLERELDRIIAEEARRAEEERRAEEARRVEEQRRAEEARLAEEARRAENARKAAEAKEKQPQDTGKPAAKLADTKPETKPEAKPTTPPSKPQTKTTEYASTAASANAALTGSFKENKGRIMFPVAGKYNIVGQFGRNQHTQLSNIEVNNTGIDIEVPKGTSARAVFDGVVSSIFYLDGYHNIVILRHGDYLTVYAGIETLNVKKGQNLKAGTSIGKINIDPDDNNRSILHFEVRHEKDKLNPLEWVR